MTRNAPQGSLAWLPAPAPRSQQGEHRGKSRGDLKTELENAGEAQGENRGSRGGKQGHIPSQTWKKLDNWYPGNLGQMANINQQPYPSAAGEEEEGLGEGELSQT